MNRYSLIFNNPARRPAAPRHRRALFDPTFLPRSPADLMAPFLSLISYLQRCSVRDHNYLQISFRRASLFGKHCSADESGRATFNLDPTCSNDPG